MSNSQLKTSLNNEEITQNQEQEVINFLENNSDFFCRYPNIVDNLQFPEIDGMNVANFATFQVQKLNQKLTKQEERNQLLIQTSIQNHQSEQQINKLVLNLIKTKSTQELQEILQGEFKTDLELDSVAMVFIGDKESEINLELSQEITDGNIVQLRSMQSEDRHLELHGKNCAEIKSEAILTLYNKNDNKTPKALLLLGSKEQQRFHEGQGSSLLEFLAGVISEITI